jgi:hypothetical protein
MVSGSVARGRKARGKLGVSDKNKDRKKTVTTVTAFVLEAAELTAAEEILSPKANAVAFIACGRVPSWDCGDGVNPSVELPTAVSPR